MSYKVRIESFEGPFDLLLYLVSRKKVDIGAISITEIADQYLTEIGRMHSLDLDVASDFLLVASTLLEIKAASLIPSASAEAPEEIRELPASEARDILIARLIEYKKYKNAAAGLNSRFEAEARMHARPFGPDACFREASPDYLENIALEQLAQTAATAYARREVMLLESEHITTKPIPVETYIRAIHEMARCNKHLNFSDLVQADTPVPVTVATFLAILELYKRSMITVQQSVPFGDIEMSYLEGSGELVLGPDDVITSDDPTTEGE